MKELLDILRFNPETPLLFTQFYFWAFFAIVYAGFALLHNRLLLRNLFLFAVSAFFYYKTSGICLLILLFCTLSDFLIARRIEASPTSKGRKAWLILSICINLSLLCFFKYSYFAIDLINNIFGTHFHVVNVFSWAGNALMHGNRFSVDRILLPVGISFYIFQTISYTVDVYRGKVKAVKSWIDYGFYVSFFPQLVAGPIVRANQFIPQIYRPFRLSRRQFGLAVFWILNGLTKKIVLSDYLAVNLIDRVFANPGMYDGFENLFALFAYSLQVYADFSGYTDIAIGVAMTMGFYLPKNFNSPYKATNAGNFWKRWHISLSKWLQEYLYIPLGGKRNATFGTYFFIILMALIAVALSRSLWLLMAVLLVLALCLQATRNDSEKRRHLTTNLNLMDTMLLGGLWHGASLNFVVWGGLNGLGIVAFKFWRGWSKLNRTMVMILLFVAVELALRFWPVPALRIAEIWIGALALGTVIRYLYSLVQSLSGLSLSAKTERAFSTAWGVAQTFVFITFTRLFFRSGSNLDPAEANRVAWETAVNMIEKIGSAWNLSGLGQMLQSYKEVLTLFVLGMLIHWMPERWKRRYRLTFASMPLALMALAVVAVVFVVYQFISSDLQAFIYFQF